MSYTRKPNFETLTLLKLNRLVNSIGTDIENSIRPKFLLNRINILLDSPVYSDNDGEGIRINLDTRFDLGEESTDELRIEKLRGELQIMRNKLIGAV